MNQDKEPSFIIMAGGNGSRMKSLIPKVLHQICNIPIIIHILKTIINIKHYKIYIIVGKYFQEIKDTIINYNLINYCSFVIQEYPLGTAHAIMCSIDELYKNSSQHIIVINGDNPLIKQETLESFIKESLLYDANIMTYFNKNPYGCGRIIFNDNIFNKIIEEKECNENEKKIKIVNGGVYCFNRNILLNYLPKINNNNKSKEYYITDIFEILKKNNKSVTTYKIDNSYELLGVNTKNELINVEQIYKKLYITI